MIIDGKAIANQKALELKARVSKFSAAYGRPPKLAIVLIGNDPASQIYINLKIKKAEEVGIETEVRADLNTAADGIIVQLPGPKELVNQIPPEKDVDGLKEKSPFLPAAVNAVLIAIGEGVGEHGLENRVTVIVGQGRLVGQPLARYLEKEGQKVIRCDEFTKDLQNETLKGDILVVATGVPSLIKADMVKPGAVVIDCGAPKPEVDFKKAKDVASAITPVPGGIGPLTVVSLLENTLEAALASRDHLS